MTERCPDEHTPATGSGGGASSGDHELVVLLDESGRPCGSAPKASVHHRHTPLHLAFSCWVTDSEHRVLLTRRAISKPTWPGVWTNAFCGHPQPGEPMAEAIHRRARDELGVAITDPEPVLPEFRYRAEMANGMVENEICPVFTAHLLGDPTPAPDEVAEYRWITVNELRGHITRDSQWFSPWATLQLSQLTVARRPFARATTSTAAPHPRTTSPTRYRDLLGHRPPSPSARADGGI